MPLPLLLPGVLALAFLLLPLLALLVRAPWRSLPDQLTSAEVWQALQLSLVSATAATAVSLVLGVPLAWLLARTDFPAGASYAPWSPCRSSCRRWSAAWLSFSPWAATVSSAGGSTRGSGSPCRSPPPGS